MMPRALEPGGEGRKERGAEATAVVAGHEPSEAELLRAHGGNGGESLLNGPQWPFRRTPARWQNLHHYTHCPSPTERYEYPLPWLEPGFQEVLIVQGSQAWGVQGDGDEAASGFREHVDKSVGK